MNWFWLTLLYLVFLVTAQLINKKFLNYKNIDEIIFGAFVEIATSLVSIIFVLTTKWSFNFNSISILLLFGMVITYVIAMSLYYTGLKRLELSVASILESTGSIYSLLFGVLLLGESFTLSKLSGVVLIIVAVFIASFKNNTKSLNLYSWIILASTVFYALGAVFDKALNAYGNPLTYLVISFGATGFSVLALYYKRTKRACKVTFKNGKFWQGIVLNGFLYSLGFWALFEAYQQGGEVSKMFPITLSASILVPISSIVLLKEKDNIGLKLVAIVVMVAGLWILGT